NRVNKDTPTAFIWSTFEDDTVPCENALLLAKALRKENIPFELHIFENGCHGLALSNELTMTSTKECINKECKEWTGLLRNWLNVNFPVVSEKKPFGNSKFLRTLLSLK
ncbi:MAG: prolyl oligopeptidase family serine peptidase, partial [Lachnospiraceae bacterium]|nr:prolyl oligopeptidase family serine peptidase [Lachnospiraceae bacterium]